MGLKMRMVNQCRKPKGLFGKLIAKGMNKGHFKMASWGITYIKINHSDIILDIGCGGGLNVYNFAEKNKGGKVYGIDYSEVSLKMSKKLNKKFIEAGIVEIQEANVSSLPFPKSFFDLVTAFESYYFWPDLINDLKGILTVLKPNGIFLLVNEAFKCGDEKLLKRNTNWSNLGNFSIHSPQELHQFLKKAGFSEVSIEIEENQEYIAAIGKKKILSDIK